MNSPYMMRFQIRDLEEFSGVKAHTIRMWEKRYGLLSPDRTDTNIRTYGMDELKAILNVAYLNQSGYKISKIASMTASERDQLVREVARSKNEGGEVVNSLKLAMLSFDEVLFDTVTVKYRLAHGFSALVEQVFVPLLEHIGVLWQTNSICPAHEHFISCLIRQKILAATDGLSVPAKHDPHVYVLYLPENELHELGLLYVNYLLRADGRRTIYLGQSVPGEDLDQVVALFNGPIVMVTLLMAFPQTPELPTYLSELRSRFPVDRVQFWIAGSQLFKVPDLKVPEGMFLHPSMASMIAAIRA